METEKKLCNNCSIISSSSCRDSSPWESLNPELLALIFVRIPPDEMSRAVPFVCRAWLEAVAGPYCWADIDVETCCRRCNNPDVIDSAVRKLVHCSRGTVRSVSAYNLGDPAFFFVANLRNMPSRDPESTQYGNAVEDEAMAVANTMPRLVHLELAYRCFGDCGLDAILTKCKDLHHLNIQGCLNVNLDGDLEVRCERIDVFIGPDDFEYDETCISEDNEGADSDESS